MCPSELFLGRQLCPQFELFKLGDSSRPNRWNRNSTLTSMSSFFKQETKELKKRWLQAFQALYRQDRWKISGIMNEGNKSEALMVWLSCKAASDWAASRCRVQTFRGCQTSYKPVKISLCVKQQSLHKEHLQIWRTKFDFSLAIWTCCYQKWKKTVASWATVNNSSYHPKLLYHFLCNDGHCYS